LYRGTAYFRNPWCAGAGTRWTQPDERGRTRHEARCGQLPHGIGDEEALPAPPRAHDFAGAINTFCRRVLPSLLRAAMPTVVDHHHPIFAVPLTAVILRNG
jgi:hypothetical protein